MHDPRFDALAKILVRYSVDVQPGWLVRIGGPPVSLPLLESLTREVIAVGGHPFVEMAPQSITELLLRHGNDDQLAYQNPVRKFAVETIDASISLWAEENTKALSNIAPARQARFSLARKPVMERFMHRATEGSLRWTGTVFPTQASAQDAEMSLSEYEDFVFHACKLHLDDPVAAWTELSKTQQKIVDFLNTKKVIRIQTPQGTDLTYGVEGRPWINCDGHENFPDGEVFTAPIEDSAEGVIHYTFPAVYNGREVDGIRLQFREGRVVEASATKNEEFLFQMLDMDEGSRILGEAAIGTNYSISQFSRNTLFDEKIGGTCHLALGAAYPESGGSNESALHWDMVCDLRDGGTLAADGEVFHRDGQFLI
ncbi:MAG: aminopeptidase [Planctomycetota bacterium]|nr:aminopeptidase [Planctomycetota bacterium]